MNSAARLWNGTADEAVQVLRDEWLHINATMAARMGGERPQRSAELQRALDGIVGGYALKLGVLLAASPEPKRAAIVEAFAQVLDVATAAKMRGVAAGTWYSIVCWINGYRQPVEKQVQADERGARELAQKAEQDALAGGAQTVRVEWHKMEAVGRRKAA